MGFLGIDRGGSPNALSVPIQPPPHHTRPLLNPGGPGWAAGGRVGARSPSKRVGAQSSDCSLSARGGGCTTRQCPTLASAPESQPAGETAHQRETLLSQEGSSGQAGSTTPLRSLLQDPGEVTFLPPWRFCQRQSERYLWVVTGGQCHLH